MEGQRYGHGSGIYTHWGMRENKERMKESHLQKPSGYHQQLCIRHLESFEPVDHQFVQYASRPCPHHLSCQIRRKQSWEPVTEASRQT